MKANITRCIQKTIMSEDIILFTKEKFWENIIVMTRMNVLSESSLP